ncbi:hypothetical protein ACFY1P_20355 [Streptomyces sp. NPDC001407]|uniref:hypothetical protein n=1 Tax=Streptomyces sp. NPDC001407 TaxID=3364573 RepID=UPI0036987FEE
MGTTDPLRGARSKRLADLARKAKRARFELTTTRRNFVVLRCGVCGARTSFSRSVTDANRRVYPAVRLWLRRHGLGQERGCPRVPTDVNGR